MPMIASNSATPRRGTLLVVGGRPDTVRKAVGLGLRVILLQHEAHFAAETVALAAATIVADYTDWSTVEPLVIGSHRAYGYTAAVSLTEPGLEIVGRINDLLGLEGTSYRTAHLLKDKLAMREHLASNVTGSAAAANVTAVQIADEQALHDFANKYGYPFIVKPSDITASLGVHKVDDPQQISQVWQAIEKLRARSDLRWGAFFKVGQFMAEEYVEGPEYSVEAFSFAGQHTVVSVTEKISDTQFVEIAHAVPARIDLAAEAELVSCTQAFLDAVGLRDGASHTEIKLTENGPKIIEGHNRIGGDRIVDLLELAYGVDFELLTVGWPFRLVEPLSMPPKALRSAATRFFMAPAGVVRQIEGLDRVREHPGVFAAEVAVKPGDSITVGSNWDRAGQIVLTAPDTQTALDLCADLVSQIEISVTASVAGGTSGTEGDDHDQAPARHAEHLRVER